MYEEAIISPKTFYNRTEVVQKTIVHETAYTLYTKLYKVQKSRRNYPNNNG